MIFSSFYDDFMVKKHALGFIFIFFLGLLTLNAFGTWKNIGGVNILSLSNMSERQTLENQFDKKLLLFPFATSLWGRIHYVIFNAGKSGVIVGKQGWLFTTEEFETSHQFQQQTQKHFNDILFVQKELIRDKVKLIILPIPSKIRTHSDMLGGYQIPNIWQNIYTEFLVKLEAYDIFYVTPPALTYFKTDTHWTQNSARKAAHAIAAASAKKYSYLVFKTYKNKLIYGEKQPLSGDLMRYMKGIKTPVFYEDKAQKITLEARAKRHVNLFKNQIFDIVLVGTSYSAKKSFGFEMFLKNAFQSEVLNVSDEGLGPFTVMNNYLKSDLYRTTTKPKMIIWEMPERYLPRMTQE